MRNYGDKDDISTNFIDFLNKLRTAGVLEKQNEGLILVADD